MKPWKLWWTIPLLIAAGMLLPGLAKADPVDSSVVGYALLNAPAMCLGLEKNPTIAGVNGLVEAVVEDGLTAYQAGEAIAIGVQAHCPQYWPVLNAYIAASKRQLA